MNPLLIIFFASALLCFLSIIGVFLMAGRLPMKIEQDRTPEYQVYCSGRIGMASYKGPFLRVTLYSDFITIKGIKGYLLRYDNINRIEEKTGFFKGGLYFHHEQEGLPNLFVLQLSKSKRPELVQHLSNKNIRIIAT